MASTDAMVSHCFYGFTAPGQFAGIVLGGCSVLIRRKKGDHAKTGLDARFKRFVAGEGVVEHLWVPQHSLWL